MHALYQVMVETHQGIEIPFGPKMMRAACEKLCVEMNKMIIRGKEKTFSNPRVVNVANGTDYRAHVILEQREHGPADGRTVEDEAYVKTPSAPAEH